MAVPLPLCNIGDVIQATIEGEHAGQTILSTFHYSVEAIPATPVSYNDVYTSLATYLKTNVDSLWKTFQNCLSEEYLCKNIRVQAVNPLRIPYFRLPVGEQGGQALPALPPNSSVSVLRRGIFTGEPYTGRVQVPAVPIDWVADGKVIAPAGGWIFYGTFGEAMLEGIDLAIEEGIHLEPGLFTYPKTSPPVAAEFHYLFDYFTQLEVRTQRTRTVGQGI